MFDNIFIYGCSNSTSVRDIFQSSMRCRHIKENKIYYSYSLGFDNDGAITKNDITKAINERGELIKGKKCETWLKNIIIFKKTIFTCNLIFGNCCFS